MEPKLEQDSSLMSEDTPTTQRKSLAVSSSEAATTRSNSRSARRKTKKFAVSVAWERQVVEGNVPFDHNSVFCCCARRVGHMYSLCRYADGSPIVIAGPCWPFCMFITLPLILGITFAVSYFLIFGSNFDLPWWVMVIYGAGIGFTLGSLFCVSCRDPGLMERVVDEEAGQGGWFWNEQVGSFRPPGALYCRECGVLIQDYDHLCPWTGTGIGRNNMTAFRTFVVSVNVLCYMSIGILCWALLKGFAS